MGGLIVDSASTVHSTDTRFLFRTLPVLCSLLLQFSFCSSLLQLSVAVLCCSSLLQFSAVLLQFSASSAFKSCCAVCVKRPSGPRSDLTPVQLFQQSVRQGQAIGTAGDCDQSSVSGAQSSVARLRDGASVELASVAARSFWWWMFAPLFARSRAVGVRSCRGLSRSSVTED